MDTKKLYQSPSLGQSGRAILENRAWPTAVALRVVKHIPQALGDGLGGAMLAQLSNKKSINPWGVGGMVLAYAAPHVIGQRSLIAETAWKLELRKQLQDFVSARRSAQPALWLQLRSESTGRNADMTAGLMWLADSIPFQVGQTIDWCCGLTVQLAMMSLLVDKRLGVAFMCALGAALTAGSLGHVWLKQNAAAPGDKDPHTYYTKVRHHVWDNVVLGNTLNRERFETRLADAAQSYAETNLARELRSSHIDIGVQALAAAVFVGFVVHETRRLHSDPAAIRASWAQLLPLSARTIATLGQVQQVLQAAQETHRLLGLLARDMCAMSQPADLDPKDHINSALQVIAASGKHMPWQQFIGAPPKRGLWYVEGRNGVGKSMVMVALKQALGRRAILMPALHDLMFDVGAASTGQRTQRALKQLETDLSHYPMVTTVLFDETDANLDTNNRAFLSDLQKKLAQRYLIVAVSHHPRRAPSEAEAEATKPC